MILAKPGPKPPRPLWHFILPGLFVGALFVVLFMRKPVQMGQLKIQGETMGTYWSATLIIPLNETRATPYEKVVQDVLDDVNNKMSTWLPRSEISLFNASRSTLPQPISKETLAVLESAKEVYKQSGGAFDVTIRPLVNAWGFGVGESESPPTAEVIAEYLSQIGSDHLKLNPEKRTATKGKATLEIDLSAIAKGFGVDQVHAALSQEGVEDFMIEVGGEVRTSGLNAFGKRWTIGIEKPDASKGTLSGAIGLNNNAVATSGDYRNYKESDGERISHTIDPRTGRPIAHKLASVTVISQSTMNADAWATALNVLGPDEGMALANEMNMPVMMVVRNEQGGFDLRHNNLFETFKIDIK